MRTTATPVRLEAVGRKASSEGGGGPAPLSEELLWVCYRVAGDLDARTRLLERYFGLVRHVAWAMARRIHQVEVADLEGAGTLGLLQALDGFDPSRGLAFSTYAVQRIRGAMLDDLRARDWAPRSVRAHARRVTAALHRLEQQLGRVPARPEVAAALGIDLATLWRWEATLVRVTPTSLDDGGAGRGLEAPTESPSAADGLLQEERGARLQAAIGRLSERERAVIVLSYYEGLTLQQIGKLLQVTESRVSQIRRSALNHLRDLLAAEQAETRGAA